ncbi:MAG: hypothetical protein EKK55_24645 [Rhodocyclaceae bacterium]|nr:MAG: hypothetical protein EKK55_24645 [Rhodocyclaceae bacterium]
MNDELRDRLAHAYYRRLWGRDMVDRLNPVSRIPYFGVTDVMLDAIEDAGYVIVERPTEERLAFVRDPDDQGDEE